MKHCKTCNEPIRWLNLVCLTIDGDHEKAIYCGTSYRLTTASFYGWFGFILMTLFIIALQINNIVSSTENPPSIIGIVMILSTLNSLALISPLLLRYKSGAHLNETI